MTYARPMSDAPSEPGVAPHPASGFAQPTPPPWERLRRLERLADALDSRYRIPGTSIRFGWDSILGLVPGIGDIAPLGPAGFILLEGHRLGLPTHRKAKMAGWTALDWAVGSVPVIGDILDVGIKANRRNVAAIRTHLEEVHGPAPFPPATADGRLEGRPGDGTDARTDRRA